MLIRDGALAVAAATVTTLMFLLFDAERSLGTVAMALIVAQTLLICLRRVSPLWCLAAMLVLQVAMAATVPDGTGLRGFGPVVVVYTCGTVLATRTAIGLAVLTTGVEIGAFALLSMPPLENPPLELAQLALQFALTVTVYAGAALLGSHLSMRRRYAEVVEDAHRARTEAVLTAERARTARELHDVAAHHLTSLIVQATLVERLLDRDPEAARRHAAAVREEGRNTLNQLRQIVGALREDDGIDPDLPDGSGLAMIDRLASGDGAALTVHGTPGTPDPAVELALYRVAREALTNARDHAPAAPVTVTLTYQDSETTMEIHNGPPATAPSRRDRRHRGFGLIGMRERAALIGGTLEAGPAPDGGWQVEFRIPHQRPAS
ncbi:sensor histidine kinase [Actinoplanes couchii]|uniref:histidine kinase n=1 Tax=Actinoplanes couchii TaxID=403638 RepID=A0ABQ3XKN3_9ACTN|nr:histidine kinase [Actinoplanes couchii]MDR6319545.1 signal transduction histidine kinase [Actinoplanes couchii]GID59065.1 ATPase [Actinoplanes couchii]